MRMGTTCSADMRSSVAADQVEEGKEEDPDDVDEVPVEPGDLDRRVVGGADATRPRHPKEPGHDAEPDDHVEGMEPGQREVEREEDLRRVRLGAVPHEVRPGDEVLVELVPVLVALDAQ